MVPGLIRDAAGDLSGACRGITPLDKASAPWKDGFQTMKDLHLTIAWNGDTWNVEHEGVPPDGFRLDVTIPAVKPVKRAWTGKKAPGKRLFPEGTWLYLPLEPLKDTEAAWALWLGHKRDVRPALAAQPEKALIPIRLEEDLHFNSEESTQLAPCCCSIGENEYDSLNKAASAAIDRWRETEKASVNVFDNVCFLHDGMLPLLKHMRQHLRDGTPLPERKDADDGTPMLFGDDEI